MKKIILIYAVVCSTAAFAQESNNTSLVNVTGTGIVHVVPDNVVIRSRVEHEGESASEVKAQNDKVINEILKFLKSEGIPDKNIQTEYIKLNKQYDYKTKEYSYAANQAISIKLEDLNKYEKLMSGLMNSGLNRIDGIEFQTSQKEKLESEARKKAILNAKEIAEELVAPLGQKLGKATSISEVDSNHFQPVYRTMMMQDSASKESQTIAPGEMELKVKVQVGFFLY